MPNPRSVPSLGAFLSHVKDDSLLGRIHREFLEQNEKRLLRYAMERVKDDSITRAAEHLESEMQGVTINNPEELIRRFPILQRLAPLWKSAPGSKRRKRGEPHPATRFPEAQMLAFLDKVRAEMKATGKSPLRSANAVLVRDFGFDPDPARQLRNLAWRNSICKKYAKDLYELQSDQDHDDGTRPFGKSE